MIQRRAYCRIALSGLFFTAAACGPSAPGGPDGDGPDGSVSLDDGGSPDGGSPDSGGLDGSGPDAGWTRPPTPAPCGLRLTYRGARDQFDTDEDLYISRPDGTERYNLTETLAGRLESDPQWAPDGSRLAFFAQGAIYTMAADGSDERRVTPGNQVVSRPAWSPDSRRLAYFFSGRLMVMNADGTGARQVSALGVTTEAPPSWSPDGTQLAIASTGDVYAVRVSDGTARRLTMFGQAGAPVWSPDGARIAFATPTADHNVGVHMVEVATGAVTRLFDPTLSVTESQPSWSPDGRALVYRATLYSAPTGGLIHVTMAQPSAPRLIYRADGLSGPRWSPDGTRIVADVVEGATYDLATVNPDGSQPLRLNLPRDRFRSPLRPIWGRFPACR